MIDTNDIIKNYSVIAEQKKILVNKFLLRVRKGTRYLLGRNQHSKALAEIFDIDGYVDDFMPANSVWNGKPVFKSSEIPKGAIVVNCSMSISPISALRHLATVPNIDILNYSDFCRVLPNQVALPDFVVEGREEILKNINKWQELSEHFADIKSQNTLDDLIGFRLTGDPGFMENYKVRFKDQYFEEFLGSMEGAVFADCGGFDGDTTEEFCLRYPNYKSVLLFEPSEPNLIKAKERLSRFKNINFLPLGLSDKPGRLAFDPDNGSASKVDNSGSCRIEVTTLDHYKSEEITFIKMDLEGWEMKALQGASILISRSCPQLAISVYHHTSDFIKIPEYILSIQANYKIYLRHYTEGWSETIMFFVNNKSGNNY